MGYNALWVSAEIGGDKAMLLNCYAASYEPCRVLAIEISARAPTVLYLC